MSRIAAPRKVIQSVSLQSIAPSSSVASIEHAPDPHKIVAKHDKARCQKAERDERMDITLALTDVRTYMGGFTRPTDLRVSSWYPGGAYIEKRKLYRSPNPAAYHPHTVYLMEGRYPVIRGHGRVDAYPTSLGVCREGHFPKLVEVANSSRASYDLVEAMDNARWPSVNPRRRKRVRWWEDGEDGAVLRRQALEGDLQNLDSETQLSEGAPAPQQPSRQANPCAVPTDLLSMSHGTHSVPQIRAFHTSAARRADEDDRSDFERRRQDIPASSWSRPPRPSQDSDDSVVPTFYVERKKQRDSISQRKEEEGGLMSELNAGILSEGLAAETRSREEKIPVEVILPDGTVSHPSGFEPPTAETEFHPIAAKVSTQDHPLFATVKQPWDERDFIEAGAEPISVDPLEEAEWVKRMMASGSANDGAVLTGVRDLGAEPPVGTSETSTSPSDRSNITTSAWDSPSNGGAPKADDPDSVVPSFYIERKKQRDSISQRKEEEGGLMSELNAGILSDELAAQTREREEKIPVEVVLDDGTVAHPSGFIPPTAETEFHPVAAKSGDTPKQPWTDVLGKKPTEIRKFHMSAVAHAREVLHTPLQRAIRFQRLTLDPAVSEETILDDPAVDNRKRYFPTLRSQPFWRPLLTVTLATRPLADSLARLSRSLPRGQAYYAAIPDDERKDFLSFNDRVRNLRLNRMQQLTHDLACLLGGARGGLVGIRFSADQRGRGIGGEGLADAIPKEKRMVKVGVGEWYPLAEEVKERFLAEAERGGYADCIEVFGVDEWGRRTDGKQCETYKQTRSDVSMADLVESNANEELDID